MWGSTLQSSLIFPEEETGTQKMKQLVHGAGTTGAVSPVQGLWPLRYSVPMLCVLWKLQK